MVNSPLETLGVLSELFTWVGLVIGAGFLLVVFVIRAVSGSWVETAAVVVDREARWMTEDREVHSRRLTQHEISRAADLDDLMVFYSERSPDRMRLDRWSEPEKALRLVGIVLASVGVAAGILSIVLLFIPE